MREFNRYNTGGSKQELDTANKVIQIRNLCEYVITQDQVRLMSGGDQVSRRVHSEESHYCRDALRFSHRRNVRRWFDPQGRHYAPHKILQQISIVACDLDNPAFWRQAELLDYLIDVASGVTQPGVRERGKV